MKGKQAKGRGEQGFTLIELLIVITVVGFVIAVLVGVFGNPLKASSTEHSASLIADHLRSIGDGADYYYAKTTTEASTMAHLTTGTNATLKATPVPPSLAKDADYTGTYAYTIDTTTYTAWNTSAADTVVVLNGITDDVCSKINEKFAGAPAGAAPPISVDGSKDIQCYRPANATYATVVKPIYSH